MKNGVWVVVAGAAVAVAAVGCRGESQTKTVAPGKAEAAGSGISEHRQMDVEQPAAPSADPQKVVARVGGEDIRQAEVNKVVDGQIAQYGAQVPENFRAQMRAQMQPRVIEMLIAQRVLRAEAAKRGMDVDADELAARVDKLAESLPEGVTLDEALERRGMDRRELLANIKEGMQFEKMIDAETEGKIVKPTEADAQAFYDEKKAEYFTTKESAHASHILVKPETEDDQGWAKAREEIEALAKQLADGADFATLAGEHSACPSKAKGGDLGEFARGQMVPEFDAAVFSQELNVVGKPVKTQFGYHLIKVTRKQVAGEVPFDEVKERIIKSLEGEAKAKRAEAFIEELKAKADVVLVD